MVESSGRLRTREKLASLKLENSQLKSKLKGYESKLKAAEKNNAQLNCLKISTNISTVGFLTVSLLFLGEILYKTQIDSTDCNNQCHHIPNDSRIIKRDEWADKELKANISDLVPLSLPVSGVIAHHTSVADNRCFSYEECAEKLNAILDAFLNELKFSDIGYNYMIGEDGNIYEGRGTYKGAHTKNVEMPKDNIYSGMSNSNTIGIAMLGNFKEQLPNEKALKAFDVLIRILRSEKILKDCVTLVGKSDVVHREGDSPGTRLVEYWTENSPFWHTNCTKANVN